MAGHSKWANIKHRKAAQDAKRGKLYTKVIREVTVAARSGAEVADNPRLRLAVDKALAVNVTKDTIERAIARGSGTEEADQLEELLYEGYAAGGVALLIEAMTDNRNRTIAQVRHAFSKHQGNLGADGSVAYLFKRLGIINVGNVEDEDALMLFALENGAEDIEEAGDGEYVVQALPAQFHAVRLALLDAGFIINHAELMYIPENEIACDAQLSADVCALIDALEVLDDVQQVHSNGAFTQDEV